MQSNSNHEPDQPAEAAGDEKTDGSASTEEEEPELHPGSDETADSVDTPVDDDMSEGSAGADDTDDVESCDVAETECAGEQAESPRDARRFSLKKMVRLPRRRRGRVILIVVLVVLLGGGGGGYTWWQAKQLPDGVAFRVGDRQVTKADLKQRSETLKAMYGVQRPKKKAKVDGYRRALAQSYALYIVLDKAAKDQGVQISEKSANDVLARYISNRVGKGENAREKFITALGNVGTSEKLVVNEIKHLLSLNRLHQNNTNNPKITNQELQKAFQQRKDRLGKPERRRIRNIVVRTRSEAEKVVDQIKAGASFADVARNASLDGKTRDSGGKLGVLARAQLEESYRKAGFNAPVDELFGPVKTKHGWNVGKVVEIIQPKPAAFKKVKTKLKEQLQQEQRMKQWRDWMTQLLQNADIQYADKYRPKTPDSLPPARPGRPATPGAPSGHK